jgi:hypothetical protein
MYDQLGPDGFQQHARGNGGGSGPFPGGAFHFNFDDMKKFGFGDSPRDSFFGGFSNDMFDVSAINVFVLVDGVTYSTFRSSRTSCGTRPASISV